VSGEDDIPPPPDGFVRWDGRGGFQEQNGPWFHRYDDDRPDQVEHALYLLPRHTNGLGVLHGGMLSAFMDGLLGGAASRGAGRPGMTVHLSVDFLRMARRGEWLIGRATMTHAAREVAFAEGEARVAGRLVGRATGVFKLMGRRG
jgi:uncharacterized protein (TIGR00369 family)